MCAALKQGQHRIGLCSQTYGTISSLSPLKKSTGTSLILGNTSLLGHIWWQSMARYFAGGKMLIG
jgi:hypothetical protein